MYLLPISETATNSATNFLSAYCLYSTRHLDFSQLERGTKGISIENLVNIANALGVTVDTILGDSMRHFPQQPDSDFNEIMRDCSTFERRVLIE